MSQPINAPADPSATPALPQGKPGVGIWVGVAMIGLVGFGIFAKPNPSQANAQGQQGQQQTQVQPPQPAPQPQPQPSYQQPPQPQQPQPSYQQPPQPQPSYQQPPQPQPGPGQGPPFNNQAPQNVLITRDDIDPNGPTVMAQAMQKGWRPPQSLYTAMQQNRVAWVKLTFAPNQDNIIATLTVEPLGSKKLSLTKQGYWQFVPVVNGSVGRVTIKLEADDGSGCGVIFVVPTKGAKVPWCSKAVSVGEAFELPIVTRW